MDMVTFSHRSHAGNKHAIVLRCLASSVFYLLPCYFKSDAPTVIEMFILKTRSEPHFATLKPVATIITDNAGEWSRTSTKWNRMLLKIGEVSMIYTTPETSKELGHGEVAIRTIERITKSILMQQSLPPHYWEWAAHNGVFLLNRFSNTITQSVGIGHDGETPLPQARATHQILIFTTTNIPRTQLFPHGRHTVPRAM